MLDPALGGYPVSRNTDAISRGKVIRVDFRNIKIPYLLLFQIASILPVLLMCDNVVQVLIITEIKISPSLD